MKKLIAVTVLCLALNAYGQRRISSDLILDPNHCDSSILSRQEFENCKRDSSFNHITLRSNYITFIKTKLLPKYRIERKALILPEAIKKDVKLLKAIYDSTLNFKLQKISADMDRNQMYVQPKAYISSILALETFKFYPDIYAILLNEIHLILNPTSDSDQVKQIQKLVDRIYSSMAIQMKNEVQKITLALADERKAYTHELDMFQGTIEEKKRKEYNVINFLVWTE